MSNDRHGPPDREEEHPLWAREAGISVEEVRAIEERLCAMPMERFLDRLFGPGRWVHDPEANLWIGADPHHRGPGFGFMAIREDRSFFTGVVPEKAFQ